MLDVKAQEILDQSAACPTPSTVAACSPRQRGDSLAQLAKGMATPSDLRVVSERCQSDGAQIRAASPRRAATSVAPIEVELQRRLDVARAAVEKATEVVNGAQQRCSKVISRDERRRAMVKLEISKLILLVGRNYNLLEELEVTLGSVLEVSELPVYHSDKYSDVPFSAREIPPHLSLEDLERANKEMMDRLREERAKRINDPPRATASGKRANSNLDEVMWLIDSLEDDPSYSQQQFDETLTTGTADSMRATGAATQRRYMRPASTNDMKGIRVGATHKSLSSGDPTLCSSTDETDDSVVSFSISSESIVITPEEIRDLKLLKFMYDATTAATEEDDEDHTPSRLGATQHGSTMRSTSSRFRPTSRESIVMQQLSGVQVDGFGPSSPTNADGAGNELSAASTRPGSGLLEDGESFYLDQQVTGRVSPAPTLWRSSPSPATVVIDTLDSGIFTVLGELYKAYDYKQFFRDLHTKHVRKVKTDDEYEAEIENILMQHMDEKRKRAASDAKDEFVIKKWGTVAGETSRVPTPRLEVETVLPSHRDEEIEEVEKKSWLQSVAETLSPLSPVSASLEEVPPQVVLSQICGDALVFARDMGNGVIFFIKGRNEDSSRDENTQEVKQCRKKGKGKKGGDEEGNTVAAPPVYDNYTLYVTNHSDTCQTLVVDIEKVKAKKLRVSAHVKYAIPQECIVTAPEPGSVKSLLTFFPKRRQQIDFNGVLKFREAAEKDTVSGAQAEEEKRPSKTSSGVSVSSKEPTSTGGSAVEEAVGEGGDDKVELLGGEASHSRLSLPGAAGVCAAAMESGAQKTAAETRTQDDEYGNDEEFRTSKGRRRRPRDVLLSKLALALGATGDTYVHGGANLGGGEGAATSPGPPRGERELLGEQVNFGSKEQVHDAGGAASRAGAHQAADRTCEAVVGLWPTGTAPVDHWGVPLSNEEHEAFERNCVALTILQGSMWSGADMSHDSGGAGGPREHLEAVEAAEEELVDKILVAPSAGDVRALAGRGLTGELSAEGMAMAYLQRVAAEENLDASCFERGGALTFEAVVESTVTQDAMPHMGEHEREGVVSPRRKRRRPKRATSSAKPCDAPPSLSAEDEGGKDGKSATSRLKGARRRRPSQATNRRKKRREGAADPGIYEEKTSSSNADTAATDVATSGVVSSNEAEPATAEGIYSRDLSRGTTPRDEKVCGYSARTTATSGRQQPSPYGERGGEALGDMVGLESCRESEGTSPTPGGQYSHRGMLSGTRSSVRGSVDEKSSWKSSVTPYPESNSVSLTALKHLMEQVRVSEKRDAEAPTGFVLERDVTEYSSLFRKNEELETDIHGLQRRLFPDRREVCAKSQTHGRVAVYVPDDLVAGTLISSAVRDRYYGKMSRLATALRTSGQAENIVESLRDDLHDVARMYYVRNRRGNQMPVNGSQGNKGEAPSDKCAKSYATKGGITSLPVLCAPDVVDEVRDLKVAGEEARDLFVRDPARYDCVIDDIVQRAILKASTDHTSMTASIRGSNDLTIRGAGFGGARAFRDFSGGRGGALCGTFSSSQRMSHARTPWYGGDLGAKVAGSLQRLLDEQNRAKRIVAYVLMEMRRMWRLRRLEGDIALRAAVDRFVFRSLSFTWRIERRRVLNLNKLISLLDRRTGRVRGWVPFYSKDNVLVDRYIWEPVPPKLSHQMKVVHHAMCLARRQELLPLRTVRYLSSGEQSSHHLMFGYSRRVLETWRSTAVRLRGERRARNVACFQNPLRRFSPQSEYLVGTPKK